jgi:putative Ca2+/H+ antiporter (TMEM165/GDT1 family)
MLAFIIMEGVSIAIGGPLLALLPVRQIQIASSIAFVFFDIIHWIRKEETGLDSA